mgnify:CR=1 FL=1
MWSLFDFLLPGFLGSRDEFRAAFELPSVNGERETVTARLAHLIGPFILRRRKDQVCRQLPPKLEQHVFCEMEEEQRQAYGVLLRQGQVALDDARRENWEEHRMRIFTLLLRLRQLCCHPALLPPELLPDYQPETLPSAKMNLAREIILEALDSGHRILFFSQFTSLLKVVREWLDATSIPYEYLDGSTRDRQGHVDRFNADASIPIFLLSLKAGGTGLNLTGADTVIHYDQWWNPMVEDQATDRTHRIGQSKPVTAVKLVVQNSIEERILALQDSKRELFEQVLAGAPARFGELTAEDVEFLLGA